MPHVELVKIAESLFDSIQPGQLSDKQIKSLHLVFQNTCVAALDIIDKWRVIKLVMPYGRTFYRVLGGKKGQEDTYTVHPHLMSAFSASCTCPAFVYSVLLSDTQLMCKHILAVRLAERLGKCCIKQTSDDDLALYFFPPSKETITADESK